MILICGVGAVGTVLAAHLAAAGQPLGLYARQRDLARLSAIPQLRVDPARADAASLLVPRPPLRTTLDLDGVDALLICVKYPDLADLLAVLPPRIPAHCTLVCTLNGVAPLRVLREHFAAAQVVPMSVMFNSQRLGPLHARLTTRAEIVLGGCDGRLLDRFRVAGLKVSGAEGDTAVWGKLLINLANAICALTHSTFRDLFLNPDLRRIYVATLDEATAALDAARLPWQLPLALPYPVYRWMLLHGGPLPWWFAKLRNGVREGAYPSMVADLEAGRVTEVEQLNGEILRLGRSLGLPVPVNAGLVSEIGAAAARQPHTPATLRARLGV